MTTSAISGNSGLVKVGGTKIAEVKTFTLQVKQAMIDATSVDSNGWDESISGRKSWTGTASAFFIASDTVQQAVQNGLLNGTLLGFEFDEKVGSGLNKWSGNGYISDFKETVGENAAVMLDLTIQGSGQITKGTQ